MSHTPSSGAIDGSVLMQLSRNALGHPLVETTALEPTVDSPTRLRIAIDQTQYPEPIDTVRLDVRWFETGDFSVHYVEHHVDGTTWQCRWDRHPNPHSERIHFHEPPEAVTIRDFPLREPHPIETLHLVLDWIKGRIERVWG